MAHHDLITILRHCGVVAPLDVQTPSALNIVSPIDGKMLASIAQTEHVALESILQNAQSAFLAWRSLPAPKRGELLRHYADVLRREKLALAIVISLESGKILQEARGEVQEMIDICDFAVGLSRQLYGLTIASERSNHHMRETWHPLGIVHIISAFNFPAAVWAWNAALALICGNSLIWKPSEKTPLTALACQALLQQAIAQCDFVPEHLSQVVIGDATHAQFINQHALVKLVSATGSTRMGKAVASQVSSRLTRTILELGGNNALIAAPSADIELALRAIVFSAVGTAGQRCTSLRRLIVHDDVYDQLMPRLKTVYGQLTIGNPLDSSVLVGPLISKEAQQTMQEALQKAISQGGHLLAGGKNLIISGLEDGAYVEPALVEMPDQTEIVFEETFAPILYVMRYQNLDQAIAMNNAVKQGLSSSIFTLNVREAEYFMSACGSDCGIANVNIGPSGAEIGGAFGGEKETGGGRESGSDAWKSYMRRATNTVNYGKDLPLAQGISFEVV